MESRCFFFSAASPTAGSLLPDLFVAPRQHDVDHRVHRLALGQEVEGGSERACARIC